MSLAGTYSDGVPTIGFRVATAAGDVLAERASDVVFYSASTVKLLPMVAAVRMIEAGTLSFDDTLISRDTFASQVPGAPDYRLVPDDVDHQMAPPGETMTVKDVLERMIVVSSNEATNMIVERVGLDAVAQVVADVGLKDLRMGRQFGDFAAAKAYGPSNLVTAADLATLMGAIVTGQLAGTDGTSYMNDLLSRQQDGLIAADAPQDLVWGSKSGSVDAIRHDVAYLGQPGPDAIVMAVCTRGYPKEDADEAIKALGAMAIALTH